MTDYGQTPVTHASVGGRRLTLDPIRTITVPVEVREVESTIPCGLVTEWGSGEYAGESFSINVGAGFGSEWGTIHYRGRSYAFSVNQLLKAFFPEADK